MLKLCDGMIDTFGDVLPNDQLTSTSKFELIDVIFSKIKSGVIYILNTVGPLVVTINVVYFTFLLLYYCTCLTCTIIYLL